MKVALSADHRGISAVRQLAEKLRREGHQTEILADCADQPCDYPEPAYTVGHAVASGQFDVGILICGTGVGMSIAANKIPGVRAAAVHDDIVAQLARTHNNANVLCMAADLLGQRLIEKIVDVFLKSNFEGGRHARRLRKIAAIETGSDPRTVKE